MVYPEYVSALSADNSRGQSEGAKLRVMDHDSNRFNPRCGCLHCRILRLEIWVRRLDRNKIGGDRGHDPQTTT